VERLRSGCRPCLQRCASHEAGTYGFQRQIFIKHFSEHINDYIVIDGLTRLIDGWHRTSLSRPSLGLARLHSLLAAWHQVNIKCCIQAQQAIDHRTPDELFPATARRLPQHHLRDLALFGDGKQRAGKILAARTDDLGAQILGQGSMLCQTTPGRLALLPGLAASLVIEGATREVS